MSKSNEVVIFFVDDAAPWSTYLTDLMKKNKDTRIQVMNLDDSDYENPPEVTLAVKESYLVVLLASPNMLTYMKDKTWLSDLLCNVPERTTVVVALCFVDSVDFQNSVGDSYGSSSSWKHYVFGEDRNGNINNVADMLDIVDKNGAPPPRPATRTASRVKSKKRHPNQSNLRVIPSRIHAPPTDVVIAFKDEVKGTIQVTITDQRPSTNSSDPKYDTKKLNPYTCKFKSPEKPPGSYILRVFNDAKEIYKTPFYYVSPHESSFTSVEYLCQTMQCENATALDRKLVDILERSLPEDDSLSVLFSKLKSSLESGIPKGKTEYPTLLHFAAASGLSEFCSLLLDVPGSLIAFQIENCDGKDPADLADIYNHPELAQYIRDFMATSCLADACDLYVAMSQDYKNVEGAEGDTEGFYMMMDGTARRGMKEEEPESPYSTADHVPPPPLQPRASKLPPVPKRHTRQSADPACPPSYHAPPPPPEALARAHSERRTPAQSQMSVEKKSLTLPTGFSPSKLMGMMETEYRLPKTAMGSSSQNELIDIMDGVKEGNFNTNEAMMLFRAWQERNGDGQTKSFKDRQKTLRKMREDYGTMIRTVENTADQMATKKPSFFSRLISKRNEPAKFVPQISHPVVPRNTARSSNMPRLSNISTTSSSSSSSRESTSSFANEPDCSSDDSDSGHSGGVTFRRQISTTSSYDADSYKRASRKLDFLEEMDDFAELPPIPPRTYTRTDMTRPTARPRPAMPTPRT